MKRLEKLLGILLVVLMLLPLGTGCSPETVGDATETPAETQGSTQGDKGTTEPTAVAKDDVYVMSSYIGTGTIAPQDQNANLYVQYVLEKFNIDISETQFLTSDRDQELGLMIASGSMPDVVAYWADINGKKLAKQFAEAGMLLEVEDMLRSCSNLMADLNETFIDEFRYDDGTLYAIPSYCINLENTEAQYTCEPNLTLVKRTDVWEELGITENPATPEDLYQILVQLSDYKLDDGSNFIPLQAIDSSFYDYMIAGMFGVWTHRTEINEEEERFTTQYEFPEYMEYLQYMARLYREGLVDPELFLTEQSVAISRVKEGRAGVAITWPNDIDVYTAAVQSVDANGMFNAFPIPKAEGVDITYYMQTGTFPNMMTLISADAEYPDRIMAYLDWMIGTEGWLCQCYGAPGKGVGCWYIGDDGLYYYDQERRDAYTAEDSTYENQVLGGWTYFLVGRYIYHINHHGFANVTESPDAQRMEAREYNIGEVFMDSEWELVQNIVPGEIEETKSVAVDKVFSNGYQTIIMEAQSDAEVEEMYNDMMDDAIAAGLYEILEEKYDRYILYMNDELGD